MPQQTEMEKFAKFIKEKREALGLTVPDVSEKIFGNRRNNYIGEIESGARKGITIKMMGEILECLNCEIKYQEN
ncbi:MAG: helix-turn-helix transcriptional regulator [Flavobacterium sp.]|nr:helix-turn-helix transcriptional regulator [Flavobacterium sp.]